MIVALVIGRLILTPLHIDMEDGLNERGGRVDVDTVVCRRHAPTRTWQQMQMDEVLSHDSALQGYTGLGTTWAHEMNLGLNHAPDAGSIVRPVDQQSSVLPLCY